MDAAALVMRGVMQPWVRRSEQMKTRFAAAFALVAFDKDTGFLVTRGTSWQLFMTALSGGDLNEFEVVQAMFSCIGLGDWWVEIKLKHPRSEARRIANWAVIILYERSEPDAIETWGPFVDDMTDHVLLLNAPADHKIRTYNHALYNFLVEHRNPSGGSSDAARAFQAPAHGTTFKREIKVSPTAKTIKITGGSALPVQDVGGVLMADATIIEDAFRTMQTSRIEAEERIMALEAKVATLTAQKQAQPQQQQFRQRGRSFGRGNGQKNNGGCFNCGMTGHYAKDCPSAAKNPSTTSRSSQ